MNSNFHYPSPRGAFGHIEKACLQIKIQLKAALSAGCSREPTSSNAFAAGLTSLTIFLPVGAFLINKAIAAPPNLSIFRGVLGWFIGFFTPYEVGLALAIACVNSLFAYTCFTIDPLRGNRVWTHRHQRAFQTN